ncbi:hypothetical protein NP233_g1574 [Leucocoprinus birnbaumii]|uniref:Phosphoglycerate mutase-like protein n=1 Tax=Leucocoprinus birnbaumii TaxID=56174 RepID=A0AAD5YZJ9_9AGAR|nr:hypothetical protein NP233_g1574 [Leucocoprinus birnbaumii]
MGNRQITPKYFAAQLVGWLERFITHKSWSVLLMGEYESKALGEMLSLVQLTAVHCSDLKRATMTAEAICAAQPDPKPTAQTSELLREQSYGSGEGKKWDTQRIPGLTMNEHYERGLYPTPRNRLDRFPGGESLEDLAERAAQVIDHILFPYVWEQAHDGAHIAVVSHGLFLAELISGLVKRNGSQVVQGTSFQPRDFRGMRNTAWTKVQVTVEPSALKQNSSKEERKLMQVVVQVMNINNCDHLISLKRQRGGIGSSAFDSRQKDIRAFFKRGVAQVRESNKKTDVDEVRSS